MTMLSTAAGLLDRRNDHDAALAAGLVAAVMAMALGGAWIFEWAGYAPCPLCLQQRTPYHVAIPLGIAVALVAIRPLPACLSAGGLALLGIVLLWSAGLGTFHAGVEYGFWPGPTDCAAQPMSLPAGGGSLLDVIRRAPRVVPCDQPAWTFPYLGISLAGFNALISAGLLALVILTIAGRRPLAVLLSR